MPSEEPVTEEAENHNRRGRRRGLTGGGEVEEMSEDGEDEISVHMRMFSRPIGDRW